LYLSTSSKVLKKGKNHLPPFSEKGKQLYLQLETPLPQAQPGAPKHFGTQIRIGIDGDYNACLQIPNIMGEPRDT